MIQNMNELSQAREAALQQLNAYSCRILVCSGTGCIATGSNKIHEIFENLVKETPGVELVLENVLETDPAWLLDIVKGVNDPRLRMCLDIGHVNAYSKVSVMEWLELCAPWISHFHIHNNDSTADCHCALSEGSIPMTALLRRAAELCPDATFTLELMEDGPSVKWLTDNRLLTSEESK